MRIDCMQEFELSPEAGCHAECPTVAWPTASCYHINQAVLGFTETTTSFKKQQQLPRHVSIPDILNMQGQVARCYAETCFQKFVSDNLQRLRGLSEADLIKEFAGLKLNLRQGFVSTGDLQSKLLTVAEAKKHKAGIELQSRKQQRLLQTEQPKTVKCMA